MATLLWFFFAIYYGMSRNGSGFGGGHARLALAEFTFGILCSLQVTYEGY